MTAVLQVTDSHHREIVTIRDPVNADGKWYLSDRLCCVLYSPGTGPGIASLIKALVSSWNQQATIGSTQIA